MGIDVNPRLTWILEPIDPGARGLKQTGYQIQVATNADLLGKQPDVWDTGKITSTASTLIPFEGTKLDPHQEYHWQVRVWDQAGTPSEWSAPAKWTTGFRDAQWNAKWIAVADPIDFDRCRWVWHADEPEAHKGAKSGTSVFQYSLRVPENDTVESAALLISADDVFSVYVNAELIGKSQVDSGDFKDATVLDLTERMSAGENVISIAVTNIVEGDPAGLTGKLIVRLKSHKQYVVPIDKRWKANHTAEESVHSSYHDDWKNAVELCRLAETDPIVTPMTSWGVPGRQDDLVLVPPALFRREIKLKESPKKALLHITALGIFDVYINGKRVSKDCFSPGWSDYRKRVYYLTYDVSGLLRESANVVAVVLAPGWHSGYTGFGRRQNIYDEQSKLLAELHMLFSDGSERTIVTDEEWSVTTDGPWREADLLMGETYDARDELDGWLEAGFDDGSWKAAALGDAPSIAVQGYPGEPIRPHETIEPVSISEPTPGRYIFDLGQNIVGVARLRTNGPAGTNIILRYAEMLQEDGTLYTEALRGARATDTYIKRTDGIEEWTPRFTFHGFRYVELAGVPERPGREAITGIVLHSAMPPASEFSTSDILVNKLYDNIIWGQKGNHLDVPTDCPQRDERLGWTGDTQIFIRTGTFNYDLGAFMTKWMQDLFDSQTEEGWFHVVAPALISPHLPDYCCPAWSDAGIICPYTMYQVYGDVEMVRKYFPQMEKYIEYLKASSKDLIRPEGGYGDWVSLNAHTPTEVVNTAYFAAVTRMMAEMSEAVGEEARSVYYKSLFAEIAEAFTKEFVGPDGRIKGNTQTCYVLALRFDLLPQKMREFAARHLAQDFAYRSGHFSTGFIGLKDLMPVLSSIGRSDLAYNLLHATEFPSWGYEVLSGATTIWERWDGWNNELGLQDPHMNSFNHYAFGAVGEWMFTVMGGIDYLKPGYRLIKLQPTPGGKLRFSRVQYQSVNGWIACNWQTFDGKLQISCRVPPNTSAHLYLPCTSIKNIFEGDKPAQESQEVEFLRYEDQEAVFHLDSGHYRFSMPWKK